MKNFLLGLIFFGLVGTCFGAEIVGDYPICKSQNLAQSFSQAEMFFDEGKITEMLKSGNCFFAAPETRAKVLRKERFYEVLVYKPYSAPIKGWTNPENLVGKQ